MKASLFELVNFYCQTKTQHAISWTIHVTFKLMEEKYFGEDPAYGDSSNGRASDFGSKRPGFEALWKFGAAERCVNNGEF